VNVIRFQSYLPFHSQGFFRSWQMQIILQHTRSTFRTELFAVGVVFRVSVAALLQADVSQPHYSHSAVCDVVDISSTAGN
jgi:hypothetical protein